jgi:hypothetical protein
VHAPPGAPRAMPGTGAQPVVRRLVIYLLLLIVVVTATIGASGLLRRAFEAPDALAGADVSGLARSLAFTLIAGPLAALLWWSAWRRLEDPQERFAPGWSLYVSAVQAVSLITAASALLSSLAGLLDDDGGSLRHSGLAAGIAWGSVWFWHRWMWKHPRRGPGALRSVSPVVGYVFGLILAVAGAVAALASLLDTAVGALSGGQSIGDPWWHFALQSLIWSAGGALVWWWHFTHDGARHLRSALAGAAVVVVGILAAALLALGGTGTVLFVLLRLAADRTEPLDQLLEPLPGALSAALIGLLVWVYHRGVVRSHPAATRRAAKLVTSGTGLAAAASGTGIIVNCLLGVAAQPAVLAGSDLRTLLLGGISALAVGGPVWWFAWREEPGTARASATAPAAAGHTSRRVYLVAVFGVSALVALITLLVIGYRLFEFALDPQLGQESVLDRVRAPLGLLTATGLVAAYHFSVWRRERALVPSAPPPVRTVGHVVLVTAYAGDLSGTLAAVRELTGADGTVWRRTSGDVPGGQAPPDDAFLREALVGVTAPRVLLLARADGGVEVIPLQA